MIKLGSFLEHLGGAERVYCNQANAFVQYGHQVIAIYGQTGPKPLLYPLDPGIKLCNIYKDSCPFTGTFLHKIEREILRPLITRNLFTNPYEADILRQKAASIQKILYKEQPQIVLFCSAGNANLIQYLHFHTSNIGTILQGGERDIRLLFSAAKNKFKKKFLLGDFCIVLLPYQKTLLQKLGMKMPIFVIPNALVPNTATPNTVNAGNYLSFSELPHRVLMTARLVPSKRLELLIKAFQLFIKKHTDWSLHIYGNFNDKRYQEQIESLIAMGPFSKQIVLEGETTVPETVLAPGGIFAFPSAAEGFGLSLAEAMSLGLPCLAASDCQASVTLLEEGRCGKLCEPNPTAWADALEQLANHPEKALALGQKAKQAVQKYQPDTIWPQWQQVLTEIVK